MIAGERSLTLFYVVSVNIIITHLTLLTCFNNLIFYLLTEQWKLIMCKHLSRILELFIDYICTQEEFTTHQHTQDFIDSTKIALGNHSWSIQNFGAGEGTLNSTEIVQRPFGIQGLGLNTHYWQYANTGHSQQL